MTVRVWVDYNDLNEEDQSFTLLDYCDGPVEIGQAVQTYDGEGNECPGVVTMIEPLLGSMFVRIDRAAFVAAG